MFAAAARDSGELLLRGGSGSCAKTSICSTVLKGYCSTAVCLVPYPHRVIKKRKMSHTSREKLDLLNRTKKVVGQLESVQRALEEDAACADVLQRLSAARGAINSLMAELMEDHIRHHMPRKSKSSEEAADDVIQIVRTYLK
jgi:DNA-binding FrmR family transcriptional regulator